MGLSKLIVSLMKLLALAGTESCGLVKDEDALWVAPLLIHTAKSSQPATQAMPKGIGHFLRKRSVGSKNSQLSFLYILG